MSPIHLLFFPPLKLATLHSNNNTITDTTITARECESSVLLLPLSIKLTVMYMQSNYRAEIQ